MALIFEQCLAKAVAEERIRPETAARFRKLYDDFAREGMALGKLEGSVDNYTYATSRAAERMFAKVGETKRATALDILNTQMLMTEASEHTSGLYEGLRAIVGEDRRGGGGMERGLYRNQRAAKGALHSQLTNMIEEFRSRNFGATRERTAPRDRTSEPSRRSFHARMPCSSSHSTSSASMTWSPKSSSTSERVTGAVSQARASGARPSDSAITRNGSRPSGSPSGSVAPVPLRNR